MALGPDRSNGITPGGLPLVGRAAELARLEAFLDGPTTVMIVAGEGGVGKSRLVAEASARAVRRAWSVVRGRAYPVGTGAPYAVYSDAFLPLLREMDSSTLQVLSRGGESDLRLLFPGLEPGPSAFDGSITGEPDEVRSRLWWTFAELLRNYAARTPLLLVLEDLQWADDSSLELLHFLGRQTGGSKIRMLCTYNDAERDRSDLLPQTERSLRGLGLAETLPLVPLTQEETSELLCRTFGVDVAVVANLSALLFGWTRGNPFFLEEIVKSLVDSGRLSLANDLWTGWDSSDFELPGTIRDAVLARMTKLSSQGQRVAELAAVVGARSSYPLLADISGLGEQDLLAALDELVAHRILDEHAEMGGVVFTFSHPLVREALYHELGLQRARLLHGAVAEAMEALRESGVVGPADELAYHFARADSAKLGGKATRYLVEAGLRAMDRRADREALGYLQQALARAGQEASDGLPTRAELVSHVARAHQHLGEFEQAAALWAEALALVDPDAPGHDEIRRALGMASFWTGAHAVAHAHFDAGLEDAETAGNARAIVRLRVAKAYCLHELGQGTEALETLTPALPIALTIDDDRLLARVHRALALLHLWVGPPGKTIEHGARAIELARRVGDVSIEFWARWGLAVLMGMRGDTDEMAAAIGEIERLAAEARSPVLGLWTADMGIELAYGRGDWDHGIVLATQAIALARSMNQRTLLARLLVWKSQIHVGRNELDEAKSLVDEAVDIAGLNRVGAPLDVHRVVPAYIGLAHHLVALGDYEEAIAAAERGLRIAEGTGYTLWAVHRLLPLLAEACLWAEEIDYAEGVGLRMRGHSERLDHKLGLAWADACDALVCWKRGDPGSAVGLMRQAAEALESIPMIPYAARLRRQMAARLIELGMSDEALVELNHVHEINSGMGAELELEKTRQMYRELTPPRPPPRQHRQKRPGLAGLTAAELDVATQVARGASNKAAAKRLGVADRTVSTHLSNIYTKLEIGGTGARMRLSNIIRRAGLLEEKS